MCSASDLPKTSCYVDPRFIRTCLVFQEFSLEKEGILLNQENTSRKKTFLESRLCYSNDTESHVARTDW